MGSNSSVKPTTSAKTQAVSKASTTIKDTNNNIGFNPTQVRSSLNSIQRIYDDLMSDFINYTNTFINDMGTIWAGPNAVEFFRVKFCPEFDSYILALDYNFENIFNTINTSASKWSLTTGVNFVKMPFARYPHKKFDSSPIKNDYAGIVGIDASRVSGSLKKLDAIKSIIDSHLSKVINNLRNSSFVGSSQQQQLINSVNSTKNKINNSFVTLIMEVKLNLQKVVKQYETTASNVTNTFSSLG